MQEAFPITGRGFIPVKELERNNKEWIASIIKRIKEEEKARFPKNQTHRIDMSLMEHFPKESFASAVLKLNSL